MAGLEKFMTRNGCSLRRRTTVAQKDPSLVVNKLVTYVAQIHRLSRKLNYHPSSIGMLAQTTVDTTGKDTPVLKPP